MDPYKSYNLLQSQHNLGSISSPQTIPPTARLRGLQKLVELLSKRRGGKPGSRNGIKVSTTSTLPGRWFQGLLWNLVP